MASSYVSGILVGNYLLQYGHVNIAYISPLHEPQWSKNRLIGLQDAFAANAGVIHNVVPMVLDLPPLHVENKSSDRYIDAFLQKIKRQKETKPCLIRALEESRNRLRDAMQREHLLLRLRPLFQKVMQDSSVSVWVAGNDMIALALWELCNERKVNVPEDISLIGFDDSVEAHVWGLTSYNFNATAVMRAMLMFLLYSSLQCTEKNEEKFREIEGFIVERRSIKKTT
jgi:DNA-binding LacI/PurR family transcriptional regulator